MECSQERTQVKKKKKTVHLQSLFFVREKALRSLFFFFLLQSLPFLFLGVEQKKKKEEGNYRNVPSFERAAAL